MPLWLYHDIIVLSQSAPTAKVHMMLYKIQLYSTTLTNAKTRTNARKKLGRWILVLRVTLPGASRFSLEKRKKRVCIPRILGVRERERERETMLAAAIVAGFKYLYLPCSMKCLGKFGSCTLILCSSTIRSMKWNFSEIFALNIRMSHALGKLLIGKI
jgi:hypothetical protein